MHQREAPQQDYRYSRGCGSAVLAEPASPLTPQSLLRNSLPYRKQGGGESEPNRLQFTSPPSNSDVALRFQNQQKSVFQTSLIHFIPEALVQGSLGGSLGN